MQETVISPALFCSCSRRLHRRRSNFRRLVSRAASIHRTADSTTRRRISAAVFSLEKCPSQRISTCVSASLSASSACARARVCSSPTLSLCRETVTDTLRAYSFSFASPTFWHCLSSSSSSSSTPSPSRRWVWFNTQVTRGGGARGWYLNRAALWRCLSTLERV